MKHLKSISLAVVVAAAALACFGAGSASAAVLCKTLTNPCGSDYPAGTEIQIRPSATTVLEAPTGTPIYEECPTVTMGGETTGTGGSGKAVEVKLATLWWMECTHTVHIPVLGALEIHYTSAGNGTVTSKGSEWKWTLTQFGIPFDCWYSSGTGTDIGTISGGAPATLQVSAVMKKLQGGSLCWAETRWTGSYEVEAPTPLYIAGS